jgi:hypothetical protein
MARALRRIRAALEEFTGAVADDQAGQLRHLAVPAVAALGQPEASTLARRFRAALEVPVAWLVLETGRKSLKHSPCLGARRPMGA